MTSWRSRAKPSHRAATRNWKTLITNCSQVSERAAKRARARSEMENRKGSRERIHKLKLEAQPGFEPGVEVLQAGPRNTKLLSRLAFWSALILVLPRFRLDRSVPILFRACAQLLDRAIARRSMGTDRRKISERSTDLFEKTVDAFAQNLLPT
jgi:hypothetical protein